MQLEGYYVEGESAGGVVTDAELFSCETVAETEVIEAAAMAIRSYADRNDSGSLRLGPGVAPVNYHDPQQVRQVGETARLQAVHLESRSLLFNRPLTFAPGQHWVLSAMLGWASRSEDLLSEQIDVPDWLPARANSLQTAMNVVKGLAYNSGQKLQWAIGGNRTEAFFRDTQPEKGVITRTVARLGNRAAEAAVIVASSELLEGNSDNVPGYYEARQQGYLS